MLKRNALHKGIFHSTRTTPCASAAGPAEAPAVLPSPRYSAAAEALRPRQLQARVKPRYATSLMRGYTSVCAVSVK